MRKKNISPFSILHSPFRYFSILNSQLSTQKGETLIEALGALAIIAIVVSAAAIAVTTALSNAAHNQNQTQATKYAQEGIEVVRQIRNNNYTAFQSYAGTYCLGDGQTNLGNVQSACTDPNLADFIRSVEIEQTPGCGANVARVAVTVAFADSKCEQGVYCHRQTHESCLSTVNPVQAP